MMTLISLAISVAFVYSWAALFLPSGSTFYWELVSLIDIMLLGHGSRCAACGRPPGHWTPWRGSSGYGGAHRP
jgi:cation transport ATPase